MVVVGGEFNISVGCKIFLYFSTIQTSAGFEFKLIWVYLLDQIKKVPNYYRKNINGLF